MGIVFSEYGMPYVLRSDNGPYYTSAEFQCFVQEWRMGHMTSAPHCSQSNRLAEGMVKTSEALMEEAILKGRPWYFFLQEQRTNPISNTIPLPTENLFGRKVRSNLSILNSLLMNERISYIHEQVPKKKAEFYAKK